MKLIFFGANGAAQAAHSGNTCFLISAGGTTVLVDAAGDPVLHLERAGVSLLDLDALVLTHRHTDHIYALPSLLHNFRMRHRTKPLTVFANADVRAFAQSLLELFGLWQRPDLPELRWHLVTDEACLETGTFRLRFFDAPHSVPCQGFIAEAAGAVLVYGADGGPNSRLQALDVRSPVLIHEATDLAEHETVLNRAGHSSARQAGIAARELDARALFLCGMRAMSLAEADALCREAETEFPGKVIAPRADAAYVGDGRE